MEKLMSRMDAPARRPSPGEPSPDDQQAQAESADDPASDIGTADWEKAVAAIQAAYLMGQALDALQDTLLELVAEQQETNRLLRQLVERQPPR
jgi:hypothetical protein